MTRVREGTDDKLLLNTAWFQSASAGSNGTLAEGQRSTVEKWQSPEDRPGPNKIPERDTMSWDETLPVSIVALRAEGYSPDGDNIIISLRTKFSSAERKYSVPVQCFFDLIVDLQRINASPLKEIEPMLPLEEPVIAAE